MTVVSRSDVFVRSEKGGEWLEEFVHRMANQNPSTLQNIMDIITNQQGKSVSSVVEDYRKQVGMDAISQDDKNDEQIKNASNKPLSIRHAKVQSARTILPELKKNPDIIKDIDSLCEHSGGTKNTLSIVNYLRSKFGKDIVSFSDQELKDYIEERKNMFYKGKSDETYDVGLVGQETQNDFHDDVADYQAHDGVTR